MEAIIITGADGFVGSHTVQHCLEQGKRVLAIDVKEEPERLKPHSLLTYQSIDVFDLSWLREKVQEDRYDTWIQFSWNGASGEKRRDYCLQMKNAINYADCLTIAKEKGCKRFVGAGSIMEKEVLAVMEQQGSRPQAAYIYGIGKLLAHYLCKTVAAEVGIELLWPMITNAYGEGEYSPRFINSTIRKIINKEPLQFSSGVQNYDFVYVTDVARAFYQIADQAKEGHEYMIGSGTARPLKEFILELLEVLNSTSKVEFGTAPYTGVYVPLSIFSIASLQQDTEYMPEVTFKEGIIRTKEWLLNEGRSL